jgi:hypothetical protein
MNTQRVIEQRPYGAVVEIEGEEVYVPRLIPVRVGRIVRHLGDGPIWRAVAYTPATQRRAARWDIEAFTGPNRGMGMVADAEDVFCHAEDNPEASES